MILALRALVALALVLPAVADARPLESAQAATKKGPAKKKPPAKKKAPAKKAAPVATEPETPILPSDSASRVASWVLASGDNQGLPWAVVDKANAAIFLYDAKGEQVAAEPVLVGIAFGDDATPGVGIGPRVRTSMPTLVKPATSAGSIM